MLKTDGVRVVEVKEPIRDNISADFASGNRYYIMVPSRVLGTSSFLSTKCQILFIDANDVKPGPVMVGDTVALFSVIGSEAVVPKGKISYNLV